MNPNACIEVKGTEKTSGCNTLIAQHTQALHAWLVHSTAHMRSLMLARACIDIRPETTVMTVWKSTDILQDPPPKSSLFTRPRGGSKIYYVAGLGGSQSDKPVSQVINQTDTAVVCQIW